MAATFKEANQVRLALKMKFYHYIWYKSTLVVQDNDGYSVVVGVNKLDDQVRKLVSPVVDGVSVKVEIDRK